jgi:hypothetical protein
MNVTRKIRDLLAVHFVPRSLGQNAAEQLCSTKSFMLLSFTRKIALCCGLVVGIPGVVFGQTSYYTTNGTEWAIVGSLPGDQVFPDAAVNTTGGFVVWQDNATDGNGWGVSARRVDSTLSGTLSTFRVNVQGTNDQENARVALLKNGGAVFVWQGGKEGYQHIFARFLNSSNIFLTTTDVVVSTFTNNFQINPAVTVLNNSNVVVVWASFDQAGSNSLQDVYGQILSPTGQTIGTNFLINQFTPYNQRNPAVAALANGGFVVAWVSETNNSGSINETNGTSSTAINLPGVNIYAQLFTISNNLAVMTNNAFEVNADSNPASNPSVAAASDGSYMVTWDAKDMVNPQNSWDIYARTFSGTNGGTVVRVNSHLYGDQYFPRISAIGGDYLIVWTSLGQDGSREGVFGQFVHKDGSLTGGELQVNTTTLGQQMQPTVASDGVNHFLVVWTSFTFGPNGFDLFAQRYINVNGICNSMAAPFVYAPFVIVSNKYQPQLVVSWPALLGISVSNYEVYVDGAATNMAATASNVWTMTAANGLTTNSTHYFQVAYTTTTGCQSPLSAATTNSTWSGLNWGGISYEWMAEFFGGYINGKYYTNNWPSPNVPPPGAPTTGAPTLLQIFLTGGNPYDSSTWLQTALTKTSQGMFLTWNTQPGFTYQVQATTNLTSWSNVGAPRFAAGTNDSIYVGGTPSGYYRVVRQ